MNIRLLWKFSIINMLIVAIVALIIDLAIHFLAANYFMTLIKEYGIAPEKAHRMFLDSVQGYLIAASLFGCVVAFFLSVWWTRRALRPLAEMTRSARRIAAGDYSARIKAPPGDEIGELATAFNRMTDSLVRIQTLRKDMVVNVAHELRTPLTNIRGYLEALVDSVMAASPEIFESLHEETLRLVRLVEALLRLARADAARENLQRESVCVAQLITDCVELFQLKFNEKQIGVTTQLQPADLQLSIDMDKLRQVLNNLLENAWRYTPIRGRFSIAATRTPIEIKVTFSNDSTPVTGVDASSIFERFYRAEPSRSREHGGAGVGLAIVKELIEAHGGRVGSEIQPNQTQLWFSLPL